jgi:hypothetical protein
VKEQNISKKRGGGKIDKYNTIDIKLYKRRKKEEENKKNTHTHKHIYISQYKHTYKYASTLMK